MVYILLNDIAWSFSSPTQSLDFIQIRRHVNSISSICIFTWLDYPGITRNWELLLNLQYSRVSVLVVLFTFILNAFLFQIGVNFLLLLDVKIFDWSSHFMIFLFKCPELKISTIFNQKSKRQHIKWVLASARIVFLHIEEQPLFVGKLLVIIHTTI